MIREILKIAKRLGAKYIEKTPDWNGKEVWDVLFSAPDEETPIIGYPTYLLISGNQIEVINDDRCLEYIGYLDEKYGFDEDNNLIGYQDSRLIKVP